jgi:cellulose synthase/poly-beta-1,6-N-acetylglucosamine synthase-like glycosyltransferase
MSNELVLYAPRERAGSFKWQLNERLRSLRLTMSLALHRMRHRPARVKTAKIIAVVPAHNEQATIERTIMALLTQTRAPDRILVVADNCTDDTVTLARRFDRRVTVIETVANTDRKVGALRTAWQQYVAYGYDFMLGVDADTILEKSSLAALEQEMERNPKAAGVMARYSFDPELGQTRFARLLIRLQRMEFAGWTLEMLHRKRNTYVLGGQATLFRISALQEVTEGERRLSPWDPEAQVEDMELTWALSTRGWETKVSATARAYAGPMLTARALWAQRRKWDEGMARLLLSTRIGPTTVYPWFMQLKMAINFITRALFGALLITALAIGAFDWNWIWITPPVLAVLLNTKHARKIPGRTRLDVVLGATLIAAELYLWFRVLVWAASWGTVIAGVRRDGWARQYKAEGLPAGQTKLLVGELA